jgi:acyl transferase domain-containing protein
VCSSDLAIGSVKANIGHTFAASGIASLIKTAYSLYHRFIPATPNWSGPKQAETWPGSPFYVAPQSKPWFLEPGATRRVAAINSLGADGACAHLILTDDPAQVERPNPYLTQAPFYLFPVAAADQSALLAQLDGLQRIIETSPRLSAAARQSFDLYLSQPDARYTLSLVGHSRETVLREIELARRTIGQAFATGQEWKTRGQLLHPATVGAAGQSHVCLPRRVQLLPRSGAGYVPSLSGVASHLRGAGAGRGALVGDQLLYPRSLTALSEPEMKRHTMKLMADSITMLQSGMVYSTLITNILRQQFKLRPDAALGYSLGETTMMYALGLWSVRDNNSAKLAASPLFRERLSGPKTAVREFWGVPAPQPGEKDRLWAIFVLKAPAEDVRRAVAAEERVYLTHVNTPQEAVIGGDPAGCQRVLEALRCDFVPVPYSHVIHCEPMRSEAGEFKRLNSLPLVAAPPCELYFAAQNGSNKLLDGDTVGQNIATAVTQQVDFPRQINRAYADGSRIFIELGPRSACTWWIADILAGQPHLAVGLNRRSSDDRTTLVQVLAQLVSHRVALDLSTLSEAAPTGETNRALVQTVSLLEKPITTAILNEANRQHFSHITVRALAPALAAVGDAPRPAAPALKIPPKVNEIPMKESFVPPVSAAPVVPPVPASSPAEVDLEFFDRHMAALGQNASQGSVLHTEFLHGRTDALQQMRALIEQQLAVTRPGGPVDSPAPAAPESPGEPADLRTISAAAQNRPNHYNRPEQVIWDEAALLEFAGGKIAPVFGRSTPSSTPTKAGCGCPSRPTCWSAGLPNFRVNAGCTNPPK